VKGDSVARGAGIIMAGTILSRLFGYVREKIIAYRFGNTPSTNAYLAAFSVPDLLYLLLAGGALSAALIPVLSRYVVGGETKRAWRVVNILANLLVALIAIGVGLIIIFAPVLVRLVAPGFLLRHDQQSFKECVLYTRVMASMVFFTALSALATGALQCFGHFTAPAAAWSVYNIGIIFGAVALAGALGILGLCVGVLIGAAGMVMVQIPAMRRFGFRGSRTMDLSDEGARAVISNFAPIAAGLIFTQLSLLWFPSFFGSFFPGGVMTLRYANRLIILPLGMFGIAISTAAFPALAQQAVRGESTEFKKTFNASMRAVVLLTVPCAVGLVVLREPLTRLLWQGGKFGDAAVRAAAFALAFYAPGLLALGVLQIVNRAFYSLKDVITPPVVGVGYVAVNAVLAFALMRTPLTYGGVALATSTGTILGSVVLLGLLRRKLGPMDLSGLAICFGKACLASAAMGWACWEVSRWLGQRFGVVLSPLSFKAPAVTAEAAALAGGLSAVAAQVFCCLAVSVVTYALALKLLRAPELDRAWQAIRGQSLLRKASP
jgi:putative peptidoglycan lipid II flippase